MKRHREDLIPGGKADTKKVLQFSKDQLVKGVLVEYEHTDDFMVALEIAMDHLAENSKYYDYLEDMEAEFKKDSAAYKGKDDPYKRDVVERQDDWMRMEDGETNLENWKHLGPGKVTDYPRD